MVKNYYPENKSNSARTICMERCDKKSFVLMFLCSVTPIDLHTHGILTVIYAPTLNLNHFV